MQIENKKKHNLRGLDTSNRFLAISAKGNNFCDFLFASLHTSHLLKRRRFFKERICSFRVDSLSEGDKKGFSRVVPT